MMGARASVTPPPAQPTCPFCDISARAPRYVNYASVASIVRKEGGGNNNAAAAIAAAPPPFVALDAAAGLAPPTRLVYADRRVVAFADRSPAGAQHFLVCPRAHVPNVASLADDAASGRHIPLLPRRRRQGGTAFAPGGGEEDEENGGNEQGEGDDDDTEEFMSASELAEHIRSVGEALLWQRRSTARRRAGEAGGPGAGAGAAAAAAAGRADAGEDDASAGGFVFGYHVPPWRSVDHLHLHCIERPFRSPLLEAKYRLEWLNWLPEERLRRRLAAADAAAAAAAGGGRDAEAAAGAAELVGAAAWGERGQRDPGEGSGRRRRGWPCWPRARAGVGRSEGGARGRLVPPPPPPRG